MRVPMLFVLALIVSTPTFGAEGVVTVKSPHTVKDTADRLESVLKQKGMTVFLRVDHTAGAKSVGQVLRPTALVIFGNPAVGTPLMACSQTVGLDLPQKALIWEDEKGSVWFSYNQPDYLAARHDLQGCEAVLAKVSKALMNFAAAATAP